MRFSRWTTWAGPMGLVLSAMLVLGGEEPPPGDVAGTIAVPAHLVAALAHPARVEADTQRDAGRKPGRVLAFFGIQPGDRVMELMAGSGYYTEILTFAVGERGQVYAQNSPFVLERFAENRICERLSKPELASVVRVNRDLDAGPFPASLDAVIMVLFYHDTYWQGVDTAKMNRLVFDALKPGGVFGIVDHHAERGSGDRDALRLHRMDADLAIAEIVAAGFELDGRTDLLENDRDTLDYNVFRDVRTNRDATSRFVLRFRKPAGD